MDTFCKHHLVVCVFHIFLSKIITHKNINDSRVVVTEMITTISTCTYQAKQSTNQNGGKGKDEVWPPCRESIVFH